MDWDKYRFLNSGLHTAVLENNEREFLETLDDESVKYLNLKCETPLHLVSKKKNIKTRILNSLIDTGPDVTNAKNKWGQTPLHYAAISKSVLNLKILLQASGIDFNVKDINGYNVLHTFIYQDYKTKHDINSQYDQEEADPPVVSKEITDGVQSLLDAGIDLNEQTGFGNSVLHLSSDRCDNYPVLLYMLNFPTIDVLKLNKFGETFLHIYARSDIFENILEVIKVVARVQRSSVQELLSTQDVYGRTPLSIMVDDSNISKTFMEYILRYEVPVTVANNLGNSVLHRSLNKLYFCNILEQVLSKAQHINSQNIFGQSCIFMAYFEPVLEMFLQLPSVDFFAPDRWGRSPFVSLMTLRPQPEILEKLIAHGKAEINTRDCYGSTPLHIASYCNYEEQVILLIRNGADVNAVDKLGDKPADTVKRHCSFRCHHIFQMEESLKMGSIYIRNKPFQEMLLDMPKSILSSSMKYPEDIRGILGLPENMNEFSKYLLTEKYLRNPQLSSEVDDIVSSVNSLVEIVCKKIGEYDKRFEMTLYPTGSTAEGTKVGSPDEFDFVLCLKRLEELCEVKMTPACADKGYACLVFKDFSHTSDEYLPFADYSGYFLAYPYLQYLARYMKRALNEVKIWQNGNIYCNIEKNIGVISGKPVFNFEVYWVGSLFKQLKISIDLVPAVYKKGWWPKNINLHDIPLVNENVKSAGCFLMLQTLNNRFDKEYKWDTINDAIDDTCNVDEADDDFQGSLLRISSAPAEIRLMKSLPEKFRHAYALAKILLSEEFCPEIDINVLPTNLISLLTKFKTEKPAPFHPSRFIKSYMLKNCVFNIVQELGMSSSRSDDVCDITNKVYRRLLDFSDDYNFAPYFLPFSDVFQFEKEERRSSYKEFVLKLKRQLSIKLVLGMFNQ